MNDIEIPQGVSGREHEVTGWYNVFAAGARAGAFNPDFCDSTGQPAGDPYGSMAALSVVVPNRISNGQTLPRIQVLGRDKLASYDAGGAVIADGVHK